MNTFSLELSVVRSRFLTTFGMTSHFSFKGGRRGDSVPPDKNCTYSSFESPLLPPIPATYQVSIPSGARNLHKLRLHLTKKIIFL